MLKLRLICLYSHKQNKKLWNNNGAHLVQCLGLDELSLWFHCIQNKSLHFKCGKIHYLINMFSWVIDLQS
jgi:hypothetical protein